MEFYSSETEIIASWNFIPRKMEVTDWHFSQTFDFPEVEMGFITAQKKKFSIKDFFGNKKNSLMENFIFCAVHIGK